MKKGITITPKPLAGTIKIMPSKSMSHRMAICAALAGGSQVRSLGLSEDITATCRVLRGLGCEMELTGDTLTTGPKKNRRGRPSRSTAESLGAPCALSSRWRWTAKGGVSRDRGV